MRAAGLACTAAPAAATRRRLSSRHVRSRRALSLSPTLCPAAVVDGGKMSQYVAALAEGEAITVQGPSGMHEYLGRGVFKSGSKQHTCAKLGMIAGGTGITPMLQIAATILDDPTDTTEVSPTRR